LCDAVALLVDGDFASLAENDLVGRFTIAMAAHYA
jgi:hypothetical protein